MKKFLLLALISTSLSANTLISKAEFGYTCNISQEKTSFSYNEDINVEIKEGVAEDLVTELSSPAIQTIGGTIHRWMNFQKDYFVLNSAGELTNFYSVGFRNVLNNGAEATELIEITDRLCNYKKIPFLGTFDIYLDLGNGEIIDRLVIDTQFSLNGTYSFPGRFTERIRDIKFKKNILSFKFDLKEGESPKQEISVRARFTDHNTLEGTILIGAREFPINGVRVED